MAYQRLTSIRSKTNNRVSIDTVKGEQGQPRFILRSGRQFMFIEPKDLEDVADILDELIEKLDT